VNIGTDACRSLSRKSAFAVHCFGNIHLRYVIPTTVRAINRPCMLSIDSSIYNLSPRPAQFDSSRETLMSF
jgi:hypothetical protein